MERVEIWTSEGGRLRFHGECFAVRLHNYFPFELAEPFVHRFPATPATKCFVANVQLVLEVHGMRWEISLEKYFFIRQKFRGLWVIMRVNCLLVLNVVCSLFHRLLLSTFPWSSIVFVVFPFRFIAGFDIAAKFSNKTGAGSVVKIMLVDTNRGGKVRE